jgi:histidinol-phosphate aminotransferase
MTDNRETRESSLELARASFRNVGIYDPNMPPCRVDLSDNTNLWGAPPSARLAVEDTDASSLTRYPAPYTRQLNTVLAGYLGVEPGMIVAGCGSDDILDSAIRAFADPGDTLAQLDPTFGMIRVFATVNGLTLAPIPLTTARTAEAVLETGARVIYLCSPNNPTGDVLDPATIESIVAGAAGIVIIDEAYAEFSGVTSVGLLSKYDNLLITRTLSKAFGLAGLRIGYAAGSPEIVREVEKSRGPYKVSSIAERAAVAAVSNDRAWMREKADAVLVNREKFATRLKELGLDPKDSRANFILLPVADANAVGGRMAGQGIAVRALTDLAGIGDALRISIGPWPMMEECLAALQSALS